MKITEEEKLIRRERIISAAFQLFCKHGIEKVTLADVASKAKVGNTSVYRYFKNKPKLVKETLSVLWKKISTNLEACIESTEDYGGMCGLEQLHVQLDSYRKFLLKNRDYVLFSYETKLYLQRNDVHLTKREFDNLMYEIKEPCISALDRGKADGSIPAGENSEDLFYAIWGAIRGYIVKIVIYKELCKDGGPWISRYDVLERGLLSALASGWD